MGSKKEYVLLALVSAFFICLYLPDMPVVNNIVVAALFVYCFFVNPLTIHLICLRDRPALLLLLGFCILQVISAAFSLDHGRAVELLARRSPLAVFPLSIGSIAIRRRVRRNIFILYAVITTLACLFCLIWSLCRTWRLHDMQWLYDDSLTAVIERQSSFVAWMVTIALFCYIGALQKMALDNRHKRLIYAAITFLLIFHYLLASRAAILFLYTIIGIYGAYRIIKTRKTIFIVAGAAAMVIAVIIVMLFPKTLNRFRELQFTDYDFHSHGRESHYNMAVTKDQWNGANIRLAVWDCGLSVARRHPLAGVPLGDKGSALQAEYHALGFDFAYQHHRDAHNTYLDVLMNTGAPGLLLFLAGSVFLPLATAIKRRAWLSMGIIAALAVAMFFESWLDRAAGCLLLGFWASMMAVSYSPLSRRYNLTASSVSPKKTRLP
jgi:O-antigen ligase